LKKANWVISRRDFLKASGVCMTSAVFGSLSSCSVSDSSLQPKNGGVRFGIVSDSHYADVENLGSRYYRQSLDKMSECIELMNSKNVDFVIELGDLKDQDTPGVEEKTIEYLRTIEKVFQKFNGATYHVMGNHDMDSISKEQFLDNVKNTKISSSRKYYSYDINGLHFIVLDSNYIKDGSDYDHGNFVWTDTNIPKGELAWLTKDLAEARGQVLVFNHQLLDGTGDHYVKNGGDVRKILEDSGKVLAVFQGHNHQGGYNLINRIHYYTLKAMVEGSGQENNAYAVVEVHPDKTIVVTGYRKAVSMDLERRL
jgi:predicted phosphodiesterase